MRVQIIFFLFLLAILPSSIQSEAQPSSSDLETFMRQTIEGAARGEYPSALQIAQVFDHITDSNQEWISNAIPNIRKSLVSGDPMLQRIGIVAVYCIDQRRDSRQLVESLAPELLALTPNHDPQLGALAARSLLLMKPSPPNDVIAPLVSFLEADSSGNAAGATVVFGLVRAAPNDRAVVTAIAQFLRRDTLPIDILVACENAVAVPGLESQAIITEIGNRVLWRQSEEVQLAAIHALAVMGPQAVTSAQGPLMNVMGDRSQTEAVRKAAKHALFAPTKESTDEPH